MIAFECIIENTILMYSPFCDGGFGQRRKIISCHRGWFFLDRLQLPLVFLFFSGSPKKVVFLQIQVIIKLEYIRNSSR